MPIGRLLGVRLTADKTRHSKDPILVLWSRRLERTNPQIFRPSGPP